MADFNPSPHEKIRIGGLQYQVMPHPAVPTFAFGQEGRKAFVFQISGGHDKGSYALKVFKQAYRVPELVDVCAQLARYAQWPGLEVCYRECLNPQKHSDILSKFPDLEYAVLMPWISGSTWYDIVIGMTPLSRLEAVTFANATAQVLTALEEAGLAHCDISAANVIINKTTERAHLIDIEDLYAPGFAPPGALPAGTDGYAHKTASDGQWEPHADRFAGAVIIAEMLAWHDARIRKAAEDEHYFPANAMQEDVPGYHLMQEVLGDLDPRLTDLFEQAWFSKTLSDCPPLKAWQEVISEVHHREKVAGVVSDWEPLVIPSGGAPEAAARPVMTPAAEDIETPAAPEPVADTEPVEQAAAQPQVEPQEPEPEPEPQPEPARAAPAAPILQPVMPPPSAAPPVTRGLLQPQPRESSDSPVVEWRSIVAPQPAAPAQPQASASPQQGWEPIMPPQVSEPVIEAHDEAPSPLIDVIEDAESSIPIENDEPADDAVPIVADAEIAPEFEAPLPDEDEIVIEEPPEAFIEDDLTEEPVYDEEPYAGEDDDRTPEAYDEDDIYGEDLTEEDELRTMGLFKPELDLQVIDERNRPHLVWSESPGADHYILQEDDNARFEGPKEYRVKNSDTKWQPPRLLWRRSGRIYYRVRAESGDMASPWSDTVAVRVGKNQD